MGLLRRTPSGEDQESRKQILRQTMEGFSLSMSSDSFYEEWMDLQDIEDIVTKDLEEKNLGDLDFAGLYSIGSSHKGFERQPSYLEIFSDELNEQFEIQLADKIQVAGEQVDASVAFQASEEEKEEQSDDSDEDYVPEYTKPAKRKRASQILRKDAEKDDH